MTKAIEVIGLSKDYPRANQPSLQVVANVNLDVPTAQVVGLLGVNGAGKSTLLQLLAGRLIPDSGQVKLHGYDLARERDQALRQVTALGPGAPPLADGVSVEDYLRACSRLDPVAQALLQELGLPVYRPVPLGQLSSGQRRRVFLAGALGTAAPILLLDEPILGLDQDAVEAVKTQLVRLARERGKTIVLATTSLALAREVSDRLIVMRPGGPVVDVPVGQALSLFQPVYYHIRVKGHLEPRWSTWFAGLTIRNRPGETILYGPVADQAALHGLLSKIRGLDLPLVSLKQVDPTLEQVLSQLPAFA